MPETALLPFRPRTASLILAVLTALGGVTTLVGWMVASPLLKSGGVGVVFMNPLTAILFIAVAASLIVRVRWPQRAWPGAIARVLAALVTFVSLVVLAGYLTPWNLALDRWLFASALGDNRMAPNTALCLAALGLSLGTLHARRRALQTASQWTALFVAVAAAMSLLGYGYSAPSMYGVGPYIPMALSTAVLFGLMAVALLAAQFECSVFAVLAARDAGGVVARRLLPVALTIPVLLGFLRVVGQRWGLYGMESGTAMMVMVAVLLLVGAIVITASALSRSDKERKQYERSLQLYGDIVRQLPIGLNIYRLEDANDPHSLRFVDTNPAASLLLGMPLSPLLGQTIEDAFPSVTLGDLECYAAVARDGQCREIPELIYGDERIAERIWAIKAFPLPDRCVGLAFEDITARKRAEQRVLRFNEELEKRVEQRTRELADANRDLLEKNQENEMFVYSVSHDLRSPLVSLQGFSKELSVVGQDLKTLLESPEVSASVRQKAEQLIASDMNPALRFIQSGVTRLSTIIDALLRLSRVGRIEYDFRSLDMQAIVTRIVESISAELFDRDVELSIDPLPPCHGDAAAVEQLFANLIGNAIKYLSKERRGHIEIGVLANSAADGPASAALTAITHTYYVRDNGLGIAEAYQEKVFQAFQRIHSDHAPGEGMGLAIVRRIVQRHGGRVWIESAPGQGSTFYVTLAAGAGSAAETCSSAKGALSDGQRTDGHLVGGRR